MCRYFLITPKLLNDLMYHPRMKVHCIYSGEWIGEGIVMDFNRYLAIGKKLAGGGSRRPRPSTATGDDEEDGEE